MKRFQSWSLITITPVLRLRRILFPYGRLSWYFLQLKTIVLSPGWHGRLGILTSRSCRPGSESHHVAQRQIAQRQNFDSNYLQDAKKRKRSDGIWIQLVGERFTKLSIAPFGLVITM
jgi:hypothetical protein